MDKKKNSKSNLSATSYDHTEPDQASISTRASTVLLDPTPSFVFPTETLTSTEHHVAFRQEMLKLLNGITDRLSSIENRLSTLENSNLTESHSHIPPIQDSDLPSLLNSSTRLTNLECKLGDFDWKNFTHSVVDLYSKHNHHKEAFNDIHQNFYNFKKDVKDYLGLDTPS